MKHKVTINVRQFYERSERNDVTEMIRNRMKSLHMDDDSYCKYQGLLDYMAILVGIRPEIANHKNLII